MKKLLLFVTCVLLAVGATAQTCDVTYTVETETMDGQDVGTSTATAPPSDSDGRAGERNRPDLKSCTANGPMMGHGVR